MLSVSYLEPYRSITPCTPACSAMVSGSDPSAAAAAASGAMQSAIQTAHSQAFIFIGAPPFRVIRYFSCLPSVSQ